MRLILLIIFTVFFYSCSKNVQKESFIDLSKEKTLPIEFGLPISISLYSNYLFVTDFYGEDGLIKVVDIEKEKQINSFAEKGEGPNEVLMVANIDYAPTIDENLYVFDQANNSLQIFDFDSLTLGRQKYPKDRFRINENYRFYEMARVENGFVATGFIENKKFILLNDSLQEKGHGGTYCTKPSEDIPDMLHAIANYGKFYVSNNRKVIVNIIYSAGIISCYRINRDSSISLLWENTLNKMEYKVVGESFRNIGKMGYLAVSLTDKFIYALYSGMPEDKDAIATYGKEIHVYDYNGKIVKKYMLDTPSIGICVTEDDADLYTIIHNPESGIAKYILTE